MMSDLGSGAGKVTIYICYIIMNIVYNLNFIFYKYTTFIIYILNYDIYNIKL